jgi:HAD superfamily hydrolase (TIGR01458 family)
MIGPVRVRGLLIDLDGTLYTNDGPVQGAREASKRLDRAGVVYRFVTNATHKPLRDIAAHLGTLGFPVEEGRIFTPAIAVVERLRGEGVGCYPLLEDALLEDLEGIQTTGNSPGYVLVGNLGDGFTYGRLDAAFRHLVAGAELIALSRNRYWQTAGGELSLDAGPFVAALEYASGKRATCVGKPERAYFELALENLGLPAEAVAMVGDEDRKSVV